MKTKSIIKALNKHGAETISILGECKHYCTYEATTATSFINWSDRDGEATGLKVEQKAVRSTFPDETPGIWPRSIRAMLYTADLTKIP